MKYKNELIAAIKGCMLYMLAFALMLLILPMMRGEELEFVGLRIVLLLFGIAIVVFMRYRQLVTASRNEELRAASAARQQAEIPAEAENISEEEK